MRHSDGSLPDQECEPRKKEEETALPYREQCGYLQTLHCSVRMPRVQYVTRRGAGRGERET
jgi:hypothetical protein